MSTLASSNQSSTRFFSALRHLARDVDDGMRKLQQKFQPERQSTLDGQGQHVTAMKLTLEWKKELEALMKSGREVLRDMRDKSKHFERSLQIIQELMDAQQTQTAQIQSYLQQYGYLLPTEETSSCTEGSETNAEKTELNQNNEKASQQSSEMSPRLEDFGISSYTLSMLSHPNVAELQQDVKVSTRFSQRSQNEGADLKHDFVPTPFQNKGLMVTPSLFPDFHNSIYGRSEYLTCSPTCSVFTKIGQTPLWHQVQELKRSPDKKKLAKALEFSDSPVPPVLHTPGIKQIPSMKEFISESKVKQKTNADFWSVQEECLSPVPPVLMTPGIEQIPSIRETVEQQKASSISNRSKVARQLRLESELMGDPDPPILHTPGIKQITQGNSNVDKPVTSSIRYLTSKVNNIYENDLEVPKSPQVTYSLKDLEEMTMSFKNTSLTDTFTHMSVMVDDGKSHLTDYKSLPTYEKSCKTEAPNRQSNMILLSLPDLQYSSFLSEPPLEPLFARSVIDHNVLPPVPEFKSFRVNGNQLEHHFPGLLSTNPEMYMHENSTRHLQEEKMAIMTDDLPVYATGASTQKCDQKKHGPRSDADRSRFGFRSDCGKMLNQTGCRNYEAQNKESRRGDAAGYIKLKEEGVIFQSVRKTSHSKLTSSDSNKENLENHYSLPHKPLFGTERSTMLTTVQKKIWP